MIVTIATAFGLCLGVADAANTTLSMAQLSTEQKQLVAMEQRWSNALVKANVDELNAILGDDFMEQDESGKLVGKKEYIDFFKSGELKITSMTYHYARVLVLGDIGIVQGSDSEKSTDNGKDTSGEFTWTQVFVRRGGHWQALASQVSPIESHK